MASRIDEDEPVDGSQRVDIARFVPVHHAFAEAVLEHKCGPFSFHAVMDPNATTVSIWHRTLLWRISRLCSSYLAKVVLATALAMAPGQIIGAQLGARATLAKGAKLVWQRMAPAGLAMTTHRPLE
jgi:hypothetical protein